jgi:hypothetical protein
VPDCYLGLLLPPGPAGEPEAGSVLIVAPGPLAASHQRPPTRRPVPVATAPAGRHRAIPDAAARPWVSGTWTACRTATAEVSGGVCGRTASVSARAAGLAMRGRNTGPYSPHLEAAMACGSSGPGHRVRPRAARVAMSAGLPHGPPRVRSGGRHPVVGRTLPSGAADRRGHQHGYRPQPGHVCRTPSVRTAVIPEAADGQSADRSLQLPRSSFRQPCGSHPCREVRKFHPGRSERQCSRPSSSFLLDFLTTVGYRPPVRKADMPPGGVREC